MTNQHSNCEYYEPLISAMIDGELDSSERNELNSHLQNCSVCKRRAAAFEQVDAAVTVLGQDLANAGSTAVDMSKNSLAHNPFPVYPPKLDTPRSNNFSIWRLVPFAAAATLLICLGIAVWPNQPVNADLISPDQIVKPMTDLHFLNQQKLADQNLMVRTLDMDLRTMKLEMNLLEPDSAARISTRIDATLEKLKLLEASINSD